MLKTFTQKYSYAITSFLVGLCLALLIFLPFIIQNQGAFFYYGDFNSQQIPFYLTAHKAIREGSFFWNWYTDLGSNFFGSYSYYLLGSPFFYLTLPFPSNWIPYLMGPLLILKFGCASLTASLYLKRFLNSNKVVLITSLVYAFSGFSIYNVFFNSFHEVIVFFPLLLLGLELFMVEDKKGVFLFAVFINAVGNYWFFIGEVVFVSIYFFVKLGSKEWSCTFSKFKQLFWEALLGLMLSMVLFLPSVMSLIGNPRTTTDQLLSGWDFIRYENWDLYPSILGAILFPCDLPSFPALMPDHYGKWASIAAWIPLFGVSTSIAYCFLHKKKTKGVWLSRMLMFSLFSAFIPVLNSSFVLWNHAYYARWFFMPILLMSLASGVCLERCQEESDSGVILTRSICFTLILILISAAAFFQVTEYPQRFFQMAGLSTFCTLLFLLIHMKFRNKVIYSTYLLAVLCPIIIFSSLYFIKEGRNHNDDEFLWETALSADARPPMNVNDESTSIFARSDFQHGFKNLGMFWDMPSLQSFHSIIPVSTMEFYQELGITRDVNTDPSTNFYALRSLLSVRWLYTWDFAEGMILIPGFSPYSKRDNCTLYENRYFIPMGFSYDSYVTKDVFDQLDTQEKTNTLIHSLVLDEDVIQKYPSIITTMEESTLEECRSLDIESYFVDCLEKQGNAASSFEMTQNGFRSSIQSDSEELLFFSVPYDTGFRAYLRTNDSQAWTETPIERVNIGFMGIKIPEGTVEIAFSFVPPGFILGLCLSLGGLILVLCYLIGIRPLNLHPPLPSRRFSRN